MNSVAVADRLIETLGLMRVYDAEYRVDARRRLSANTRIAVGRKDGIIMVEADDQDPTRRGIAEFDGPLGTFRSTAAPGLFRGLDD
jgi:hypothetical protein